MKLQSLITMSLLTLGLASTSFADVNLVDASQLDESCKFIGQFEGNAGYGKQIDGKQIALFRAKKSAEKAGANFATLEVLNGGPSGMNGYAKVNGFTCVK